MSRRPRKSRSDEVSACTSMTRLSGPEAKPITSGSKFQAEMEEYKKLNERFEAARREHEKRLVPPPLDLFPLEVFKRAGVKATTRVGKTTASLI